MRRYATFQILLLLVLASPALGQDDVKTMSIQARYISPIERALNTTMAGQRQMLQSQFNLDRLIITTTPLKRDQPYVIYPVLGGLMALTAVHRGIKDHLSNRYLNSRGALDKPVSRRIKNKYHDSLLRYEALALATGVYIGNRCGGSLLFDSLISYGTLRASMRLLGYEDQNFYYGYPFLLAGVQLLTTVPAERFRARERGHHTDWLLPLPREAVNLVWNSTKKVTGFIGGTNTAIDTQPAAIWPILAGSATTIGSTIWGLVAAFNFEGAGPFLACMAADALVTPIGVHLANRRLGDLRSVVAVAAGTSLLTLLTTLAISSTGGEGALALFSIMTLARVGIVVSAERSTASRNIQSRQPPPP